VRPLDSAPRRTDALLESVSNAGDSLCKRRVASHLCGRTFRWQQRRAAALLPTSGRDSGEAAAEQRHRSKRSQHTSRMLGRSAGVPFTAWSCGTPGPNAVHFGE